MQARDITRWNLYRRIHGLRSALFFLAGVTSLTAGAFAQEHSASSPTPTPSPTATAAVAASPNNPLSPSTSLEPVVVTGRQTSLINIAGSASEGVVGQDEISQRPILRPGEILETVPGMIVTQHAGGGKANQFFLRGYNLDHGTTILHSLPVLPALDVSLRWRFFGPRELTQSNAIHSEATSLFYLRLGYQFSAQWSIDVDVFNLLNTHAQDIAYYYASRLKFEAPGPDGGGYNDIEVHPAESRSVRVTVTARF